MKNRPRINRCPNPSNGSGASYSPLSHSCCSCCCSRPPACSGGCRRSRSLRTPRATWPPRFSLRTARYWARSSCRTAPTYSTTNSSRSTPPSLLRLDGYDVPPIIAALVSTEDVRYRGHSGIDLMSLVRVGVKTVLMQNTSQGGGSTITQQLAKNLFPRDINENRGKIARTTAWSYPNSRSGSRP